MEDSKMNFVTFPVDSTNVFPLSNSTKGGQLLTEYNLRSRESISTDERVQYMIGPSYVHSETDFWVQTMTDESGVPISSSILQIQPGRGVFNGHFVELLTPMVIDMSDANIQAKQENLPALTGRLCVGVRVMYSTPDTMAGESTNSSIGAMLAEDAGLMYRGLQVVILPPDKFKLPKDVPAKDQESSVTAHIKLAEFSYINGSIQNIKNNYPEKCQVLSANRISDVNNLISDEYVTKSGLNPKRLYAFAGRGSEISKSTWCDSTDSLMVWDSDPKLTLNKPAASQAAFGRSGNGKIQLYIPHKQIDGGMTDSSGNPQFYAPRILDIPLADYSLGTSGTVDKKYTDHIKHVAERINEIYTMPNGKQLSYIESLGYKLDNSGEKDLPEINASWTAGDYIVVGQDTTVDTSIGGRAPSTMYVVLPGKVRAIAPANSTQAVSKQSQVVSDLQSEYDAALENYNNSLNLYNEISDIFAQIQDIEQYIAVHDPIPANTVSYIDKVLRSIKNALSVAEAKTPSATAVIDAINDAHTTASDSDDLISAVTTLKNTAEGLLQTRKTDVDTDKKALDLAESTLYGARLELAKVTGSLLVSSPPAGIELGEESTNEDPGLLTTDEINERYWVLGANSEYRGVQGLDYFTLHYMDSESGKTISYYYVVSEEGKREFSEPIYLTREIPLAQENTIGGFLNVSDEYTDAGYVKCDDSGHLRLVDYDILRSGTLAYQLGESFSAPSGITTEEVQNYLNEYVNERVAFSNSGVKVIDVTIDLTAEAEPVVLNIHDIDSRFNTSVYIHINGSADSNTTINITDCEKVRIDSNISGSPKINLYRTNLYYNDAVLDYLSSIEDLKLWYEKFDDSDVDLVVDNMTVTAVDAPILSEHIEYWDNTSINDNHFLFALRSITFGSDGSITGCSLWVKNSSTYNVEPGKCIITSEFTLPQTTSLAYPKSRLTKQLKVTGSFISAYRSDNGYMIADTNFTAISQAYSQYDASKSVKGNISFYVDANEVSNVQSNLGDSIDGWEPGSFHMFSGGVVS